MEVKSKLKNVFSKIFNNNEKEIIERLDETIYSLEKDYEIYEKYCVYDKLMFLDNILRKLNYIKTGKK